MKQFALADKHADHLITLLQQYQLDKNKTKKKGDEESGLQRKEKDAADFCKIVANVLLLKAQIGRRTSADIDNLLVEVFETHAFIDWVKGVAPEDQDTAHTLYDGMFRHLFNWSIAIRADDDHPIGETHLKCHLKALECFAQCCSLTKLKAPTPRVAFFDTACNIGSRFYERVAKAGMWSLITIRYSFAFRC